MSTSASALPAPQGGKNGKNMSGWVSVCPRLPPPNRSSSTLLSTQALMISFPPTSPHPCLALALTLLLRSTLKSLLEFPSKSLLRALSYIENKRTGPVLPDHIFTIYTCLQKYLNVSREMAETSRGQTHKHTHVHTGLSFYIYST